jgi:hypothetical protein
MITRRRRFVMCTNLESAVALPRARFAVAPFLLDFGFDAARFKDRTRIA